MHQYLFFLIVSSAKNILRAHRWYGFYGVVLANEVSFGELMDRLCREIGDVGAMDAAVATVD